MEPGLGVASLCDLGPMYEFVRVCVYVCVHLATMRT